MTPTALASFSTPAWSAARDFSTARERGAGGGYLGGEGAEEGGGGVVVGCGGGGGPAAGQQGRGGGGGDGVGTQRPAVASEGAAPQGMGGCVGDRGGEEERKKRDKCGE